VETGGSELRILVLAGGGAKGAYAFGCLKAFRERSIEFHVVAGASAGALNSVLWSTGHLEEGESLWRRLSFASTYPFALFDNSRVPRVLVRLIAGLYVLFRLFWATINGIPNPTRSLWRAFGLGMILSSSILLAIPAGIFVPGCPLGIRFFWLSATSLCVFSYLALISLQVSHSGAFQATVAAFLASPTLIPFFWAAKRLQTYWYYHYLLVGIGALLFFIAQFACMALLSALREAVNRYFDGQSVFARSGLESTLREVLQHPLRIPVVVSLSCEAKVFDPDDPRWQNISPSPTGGPDLMDGIILPHLKRVWTTIYASINEYDLETKIQICLASAALPFGIVRSVVIGERYYVDGGLTDNVPVFPFLDWDECDELFVLWLEPVKNIAKTMSKIGLSSEAWSLRRRSFDVANFPIPDAWRAREKQEFMERNVPPKHLPFKKLNSKVRITVFHPSRSLGGLVSGTLRFDSEYASQLIDMGYEETIKRLEGQAPLTGINLELS
jgi:predicted acylesterase/phospholipase RssA